MLTLACLLTCASAIQFDMQDPIASHPDMQSLVNGIASRRRGLTNPSTLSTQDKNDILALHNKIRAETARGEYQGYGAMLPQAKNMKKLQWSDTLHNIATDWSETCPGSLIHRGWGQLTDANGDDSCAEALSFRGSDMESCGENLYASGADPAMFTTPYGASYSIKGGIEDSWSVGEAADYVWSTKTYYDGCISKYLDSCPTCKCMTGHYTAVVWADSEFVGCGFSQCSNGWIKNLFTCNYYPAGNYPTHPYESGSTGSDCPDTHPTVLSQDAYTDQDGNLYDLSGLCVSSTDTGTSTGTDTGTDTGTSDDDNCCPTGTSSNSACSASSSCLNSVCIDSEDPWCCNSGWDGICDKICERLACTDGDTAPAPTVPPTAEDGECVKITGWSTTGKEMWFDSGTWTVYAAQPEENGYPVYKWSEGEFYMYTLDSYYWYTISPTIGAFIYADYGYCNSGAAKGVNTPITQCDGKWTAGSAVNFYECGAEPLILSACLDDAAEYVRFLLDADDESEYMQFALHSEVGCFGDSDEPVWMHTTDDATLYYLHRDANLRAWQITSDLIEGSSVYQCFEDNIEDCTAGTWVEFYSPATSTAGTGAAVRTLDTATVEVIVTAADGAEDEGVTAADGAEDEGLSVVDDLAIVLVVLLIVAVVGVVVLLWCRRSRAKGAVTFEPNDQEMGGAAQTTMVGGDTVDVGTDEE